MCLLIDIVEERKCGRKYEHASRRYRAKHQYQRSFMLHGESERGFHRASCGMTARFPYSLINGAMLAAFNRASTGPRKGESLSSTTATCPSELGSCQGID